MKKTNFLRHVSRMFFAALLLVCQGMYAGQENLPPFAYVDCHHGECGKDVNKTFPYKGLNNSGKVEDFEANGGYGKNAYIQTLNYKVICYVLYNCTRDVPPYAIEEMDWTYEYACAASGTNKMVLYYAGDSVTAYDKYWNNDPYTSSYNDPDMKGYILAEGYHRPGEWSYYDQTARMTFDNSASSKTQKVKQWVVSSISTTDASHKVNAWATLKTLGYTSHFYFPRFNGIGTKESPLQISSGADLKIFADIINSGVSGTGNLCAVLTNDIDYTQYTDVSAMIGTKDHPYKGVFDGQGYTITTAISCSETVGLFRYVNGATIQNLELKGSLQTSTNMSAALIGDCRGATSISNVIVRSKIITAKSGALGNAGLVAVGNDSKLAITNCGFVGSLICDNKSSGQECASFVGSLGSGGSATLTSCYFAPDTIQNISSEGSYTFVRLYGGTSTITNCYYTKDFGMVQGIKVTNEQMESGEVCWKLNQEKESGDWLQTIGLNTTPTLWDAMHVYKANDQYYNFKPSFRGAGTAADPFQIETYEQLARFRDIVNAGYTALCAKQVADIDMAQYNWEPIGRKFSNDSMVIYNGVFDGNGYIIHNLNINTGVDHFNGLFGYVDGATIKNVLVQHATIHNSLGNHVGVIAGRASNTTFQNCASYGTLHLTGDGSNFSGIARAAENVTMTSCYTTYSVLSTSSPTIQYSYYGQDVENWHKTGELTYKLNNAAPTPWVQTLGRDEYPVLRGAQNVKWDGSKYVNYITELSVAEAFANSTSGNDFRIIHHGGRLYEFVITMGTQDGNGVHVSPDVTVSYTIDNKQTTIFELSDVNKDNRSFKEDWWGKITMKAGMYYDPRTYNKQVPTFWIRQGNHTSKKQTSILWVAPESVERDIVTFQLRGNTSSLNITSGTETTTAPSDESGLSFIDPVVGVTSNVAGSQLMVISSAYTSYSIGLWDATDNYFICAKEMTEGATSIQEYLPQVECNHRIVALLCTRNMETDLQGNSDTTYVNYSFPFVQKPTHSILRTNANTSYNANNRLEWAIAFPQDTDILNTDQFILARGYKEDYSDLNSLVISGIMNTTYSKMENDTLFGWFSVVDTTYVDHASLVKTSDTLSIFDTWDISDNAKAVLGAYQYPARYLYYQAYRPVVTSMWARSEAYKARWKVLQRDVLPTVDTVRVTKDADFDSNHKVMVRVILNNPYPWDAVDKADRSEVMLEAQKQLFDRRMFQWDTKASIQLERFSTSDEYDEGKDVILKNITIEGSQVQVDSATGAYYVEFADVVSMPFVHYYYKAIVSNRTSDYAICEQRNKYIVSSESIYCEQFGAISMFEATRGTVQGAVGVTWLADELANTSLELKRREYERGYESEQPLAGWTTMTAVGGNAVDDQASAAVVNEYILTITTKYRDIVYSESDTTYGYAAYYGSLDGRVKLSNGVNMPGDVHVVVNSDEPFALHDVLSPKGELILPACQFESIKKTLATDANGAYQLDSVPYYGTGRVYTIYATCEGATFVSPTGSASTINLTYEDANYTYSDIDFTCNDTKHFSGRILYTNSTVPVREVYFKVNNTLLRDAKGELVKTDAMGNFSFIVPRMEVTIQAFREGHKMSNDGYILGGDDGQQKTFTPTHDYDGLIIDDDTRVRLVGRVAGGVIQGTKPMGFGLGHNNLGDSITLVFTLEGDHTSYMYFDKKDPDKTSYSEHFSQQVQTYMGTEERIPTNVLFDAKRIVVKADNQTGEFCLDLFPTKYVVSQVYADGYSTLYSAGEGLTVLDLTDSVGLHTHFNGSDWTAYDGSFRKIYHAPVQVDLLQLRDNQYQAIYGEKTMEVGMLTGLQSMQLSWMDSTETVQYALGHPLYKGGKTYFYMVSAYEPYYYNNVTTGSYDRVPMVGYEVTVNNGMTSSRDEEEDQDEGALILSATGTAMFNVTPNNTTFSINSDYDGLRYLSASVNINGYNYESEPIAAYVTGERDYQVEVVDALEGDPQIHDYIRDPYGSGSFAYRAKGTTYNWSRNYSKQNLQAVDISLQIGFAIYSGLSMGLGAEKNAKTLEYDLYFPGEINIPTTNTTTYKNGEFSITMNDQISTSDDPLDQGAIADIYIGSVSTADIVKYQTINVVDSLTYEALIPAIETGVARLVAQGRNEAGHPYYLVICGGVTWQPGTERTFIYSQRYILNTLIPKLEARRAEAFRVAGSWEAATQMAAASGKTIYYLDQSGAYAPVYPASMKVKRDTVAMLADQIQAWQNVIATNERIKYEAMTKKADTKYSVAGTTIEHTEEASTYYRVREVDGPRNVTGSVGVGTDQSTADSPNDSSTNSFKAIGIRFAIGASYNWDTNVSDEYENYYAVTGGSGYTIVSEDNSYFDMDVYYQNDSSIIMVNDTLKNDINGYESGTGTDGYSVKSDDRLEITEDNAYVHSYIFVMRGGATREPWKDADSSIYYMPDGQRVPLGARTLKIDNPKIYVDQPVLYNVPQDEKAVFTLHISNETELDANVKGIISTVFLHVADESNPYGAKLSVDGVPLNKYMVFYIDPGMSITKTLEVERGSAPYDYENIVLEVSDEIYRQWDFAPISVHYLPTSTPVTLTQPAQNFLINTLSQADEEGKYYIPVQIEGFSTTKYDNFDHIELQYKRETDSEDQWINQCSYYANELLYKVATGNKAMIETEGKIANLRFYGEKDPVEQEYQLRAVSFCRLGNGYTTRMSSVISGTKDTRCPEVFGLPKPEDGILEFNDVISLPFTEPIAYNYLDETANFSVQGFTNNSDVDNSVALYFSGSESQEAVSSIDRILNTMDFSVEMNVKIDKDATGNMAFMFIHDDYSEDMGKKFAFGYQPAEDRILVAMNGQHIASKPIKKTYGIDLSSAMTHVGMTYSVQDSIIHLYVAEQEVDLEDAYKGLKMECHANGLVYIGIALQGKMNNIRLWSKALNLYEMTSKYEKVLSANEANLLGYWPADEASGSSVKDWANGADLTLTDVTWSLPEGFSVALDHQPMTVLSDQALKYTRDSKEDYTISFYFKVDEIDDNEANLFAAGSDALEETGMDKVRIRFINGKLYFVSEGQQYAFGENDYLSDAAWHYLAVTVNHAQNKASLFIDGALVNQFDADRVGGVAGSRIEYGDAAMATHFDQVQMWSMALPASYIKNYCNAALSGKEKELQIYLPFEQTEMNSQGTLITTFSPYNHVIPSGATEIAGDTVFDETKVMVDNKVIAPVRATTGMENLPFTWKSTDNELQITINKSNAQINNQQLNLVVRRVEDLHGNPMKNAQMWSTYVHRNVLTWLVEERALILPYGQDTTIAAIFTNASGRSLGYTISCSSPAITITPTMGTVAPLGQQAVAITVSNGLAPGVYETTINLTDEDGLCSAQTIRIRVAAAEPNWTVTTDPNYTQSMDVMAVVKKEQQGNWVLDMCRKDKVAAFIGQECVGTAYIKVDESTNSSYLFITVRGKADIANQPVEFRLWDALSGQTYILQCTPEVTFAAKAIIGVDSPVEMRAHEMRVQSIALNAGWNWISLYVDPFADKGLNNLFSNQKEMTVGDIFSAPFGNTFATLQSNGQWDATMDNMNIDKDNIYAIYAQNKANVEVSGLLYSDADRQITLDFTASEWAQMAYLNESSMPIRQALSDFVAGSEKAPAGTIIKGYNGFAVATADGTWMGSLEYLRPGEGYFVRRNGLRDSIQIRYTNSSAAPMRVESSRSSNSSKSSTMMPMVATFADGDLQQGDILLAMVGDEVIATAAATEGLFFVALHANQGEMVKFAKVRNGEVVGVTSNGLIYDAQGVAGSIEHPYEIDFTEVAETAPIYDILGIRYDQLQKSPRVLIQGSKKWLNY